MTMTTENESGQDYADHHRSFLNRSEPINSSPSSSSSFSCSLSPSMSAITTPSKRIQGETEVDSGRSSDLDEAETTTTLKQDENELITPELKQQKQDDLNSDIIQKINKGLSLGYEYDLIQHVIKQNDKDTDMSKFLEELVRTADSSLNNNSNINKNNNSNINSNQSNNTINGNNTNSTMFMNIKSNGGIDSCHENMTLQGNWTQNTNNNNNSHNSNNATQQHIVQHDIYVVDGADIACNYGNGVFSWKGIEICIKYLHSHGHKKVYVALPYHLKNHRQNLQFLESKALRDLEKKSMLVYTNRNFKQTNKHESIQHISEMLKYVHKSKGHLITNVSLKEVILDFTIYKHILEERVVRYKFQHDNFIPLLVAITNGEDGESEMHYPLCPYGKKCTYGVKCKWEHPERRNQNLLSVTDSVIMKACLEKSKLDYRQQSLVQPFIQSPLPDTLVSSASIPLMNKDGLQHVLTNNGFKPKFKPYSSAHNTLLRMDPNDLDSSATMFPTYRSDSYVPQQQPQSPAISLAPTMYNSNPHSNGYILSSSMEQSLVDDALASYANGLETSDNGNRTEFTFIDRRTQQSPTIINHHHQMHNNGAILLKHSPHSWYGTPTSTVNCTTFPSYNSHPMSNDFLLQQQQQQQRIDIPRTLYRSESMISQLETTINQNPGILMDNNINNSPQYANVPLQSPPVVNNAPQFDQNMLRMFARLSMPQVSLQQQPLSVMDPQNSMMLMNSSMLNNNHSCDVQSPSTCAVNSQHALSEKIQSVRHLWGATNR